MTVETSADTPRSTGAPRTLLVFGLLAWVAIVTAAFYAVHTPISPAMAQAGPLWSTLSEGATTAALFRTAQDLAAVLAITVLAVGAGSLLLQLILRGRVIGHLERWSFGAALGLGLLAHAFFLLGLAGGLRPLPAWLLLAVFAALALAGYIRWPWPPWSRAPARHDEPPLGLLPRVVQGFLLIALLLTLTKALAPPVAWDSHVYHLTAPLQNLEQGKITAGIDAPHFYFPALVEQLYTLGLLLRGDTVAQPLHLVLAAVGFLALFGFLRQRHGARVAWLGAGILASSISLWSLAGYAYVEWGLLAFCTLAFWALRNALDQERASWLLVSGICLGLALGVKYTAAFMALGLGSYLLWTTIRRDTLFAKSFPNWQHLGLWMLTAATVASPWYLKNLAFTGNPIYPFFFGGRNWDAWRDEWFTRWGTGLLQEPVQLLTAPWDLGVLASEGSLLYDVSLSPLLLGFMPLLLLLRRAAAPWTASALWVALVAYGGWLLGAAQSELLFQGRLLLPALPLLAAALAVALAESRRLALPWLRTSFLLEATLVLVLTLQGLTLVSRWAADPPLPYLAGAESREVYLERHLGAHYHALDHLNQTVSPEASVLFLWEPRTYLCRVQCQPDALLYNWRDILRRHEGIDPVYTTLREQGYTHVLLNGSGMRYFSTPPHVELSASQLVDFARFQLRYLEHVAGPTLEEILAAPKGEVAGLEYTLYHLRDAE